jgi:hypothetical protein
MTVVDAAGRTRTTGATAPTTSIPTPATPTATVGPAPVRRSAAAVAA